MPDDEKHNIFISWSGNRSKWVAEALRGWLPLVVQAASPWMSATDIEKGSLALNEITGKLEAIKLGISCLTPENLNAPWILYEAGALAKTIHDRSRLCTYLLGGLEKGDLQNPLGMFQATIADEKETLEMIQTINRTVSTSPIPEDNLKRIFAKFWPDLEKRIAGMPAPDDATPPKRRNPEDIAADLLGYARSEAAGRAAILSRLSHIEEILDRAPFGDRMNALSDALAGHAVPTVLWEARNEKPSEFRTFATLRKKRQAPK